MTTQKHGHLDPPPDWGARLGGVVSRLGGSVLSDWGGSVEIGGKCQDWGAPVGGKVSGLGVSARIGGRRLGELW